MSALPDPVGELAAPAGRWLAVRGNFYEMDRTLDEVVWLHRDADLTVERQLPLGCFLVNGNGFIAHRRFVFARPDGSHFDVIVQADPRFRAAAGFRGRQLRLPGGSR